MAVTTTEHVRSDTAECINCRQKCNMHTYIVQLREPVLENITALVENITALRIDCDCGYVKIANGIELLFERVPGHVGIVRIARQNIKRLELDENQSFRIIESGYIHITPDGEAAHQ